MFSITNALHCSESNQQSTPSHGTEENDSATETGMVDLRDVTSTNPTVPELVQPENAYRSEDKRDA